jgi:rubredoxin
MAKTKCPHCGFVFTPNFLNEWVCLTCGKLYNGQDVLHLLEKT